MANRNNRNDVTPPGREAQVRALKEKPGVENPYAVAWASYEGDDGMEYDGSTCPACKQVVPVDNDDCLSTHMAIVKDMGVGSLSFSGNHSDDAESKDLCSGSGSSRMDHIVHRGGKWVLLAKSTGKVLGTHATKEEAEAQERAVQAHKHDSRVRRFERVDFANALPKPEKTAEGFWRVAGKVARTGVQEYRDSVGGVRRELRLPEEVRASLGSFALQPLTNEHPPQMLTPSNAKRFVAGAVGDATMNDGWVTAPMTIYDAAAIAAVEDGRAQLSVGYSCRLEDAAGMWEGQRYDAVQRDIVVNHVALVDVARAGSDACIRLDNGDAISHDPFNMLVSQITDTANTETKRMPHKMTLDGFTIELTDANAEAVVTRALAAARKQGEDKATAEKQRADASDEAKSAADKALVERQKALDTLQGKFDTLVAKATADAAEVIKVDGIDVLIADFRDPTKRDAILAGAISKAASARTALVIEARKHLGDKEKLDEKSDLDVKKMVIAKLSKTAKLDDKNEHYVQACFDMVIAGAVKPSPVDQARAGAVGVTVVTDVAPSDSKSAYEAMVKRQLSSNPKNNVRA